MFLLRITVIWFVCLLGIGMLWGIFTRDIEGPPLREAIQLVILCVIAVGVWLPNSDSKKED